MSIGQIIFEKFYIDFYFDQNKKYTCIFRNLRDAKKSEEENLKSLPINKIIGLDLKDAIKYIIDNDYAKTKILDILFKNNLEVKNFNTDFNIFYTHPEYKDNSKNKKEEETIINLISKLKMELLLHKIKKDSGIENAVKQSIGDKFRNINRKIDIKNNVYDQVNDQVNEYINQSANTVKKSPKICTKSNVGVDIECDNKVPICLEDDNSKFTRNSRIACTKWPPGIKCLKTTSKDLKGNLLGKKGQTECVEWEVQNTNTNINTRVNTRANSRLSKVNSKPIPNSISMQEEKTTKLREEIAKLLKDNPNSIIEIVGKTYVENCNAGKKNDDNKYYFIITEIIEHFDDNVTDTKEICLKFSVMEKKNNMWSKIK
jgi:hypothetical protein